MERTFTTLTAGPVVCDLPDGVARVSVDQASKTATIHLHTTDSSGPSVDAIQRARADTSRGLAVRVPSTGGSGGTTVISTGSSNVVIGGGGTVIVNGQRITGSQVSSGITADITAPPGTTLVFRSKSADLRVTGPLTALDATTVSGDIEAGVVGDALVQSTSGDIEIAAVSQQLSASTVSGDIGIGSYSGGHAVLSAVSGDLALSATPAASGLLSARTVSGDVRLRGARHLNPQASTVSGRVRS